MRAGPPRDSLTLGEASRRLGVHPDTLRRWADARRVRSWLTPGGHRRFERSAIDALTGRIRGDPEVRRAAREVDDDARAAFRARGATLVRVLRAYATADDPVVRARQLALAETCASAYAREARSRGVTLAGAVGVVLAVRRHVVAELAATAPAFDRVLVAVVAAYAFGERGSGATIDPAAW